MHGRRFVLVTELNSIVNRTERTSLIASTSDASEVDFPEARGPARVSTVYSRSYSALVSLDRQMSAGAWEATTRQSD
jgi:hypothetical protein